MGQCYLGYRPSTPRNIECSQTSTGVNHMPQTSNAIAESSAPVPAAKVEFLPEDRRWIADRIEDALASGQLTLGKYGAEFEKEFAAQCGVSRAVSVNSGTAALEIILRTLGVEGKDVLVPANTFFATMAAVIHAGAQPILMDTDPNTFGTSPEEVDRRITSNTAAVIVVHIGGIVSPRMAEIRAIAERNGIWLVEDAAHALGASYDGTRAGAFGVAGAFSLYPTKVVTSGEGGMIVTNNEHIANEALIYRDQGKASFTQNDHTRLGYNWRMSEPHAIIGLRHLKRLAGMIEDRQRIATIYDHGLADNDRLRPLQIPEYGISNYYKYVVTLRDQVDRGALKARLRKHYNVSLAGEVYETPIQRQSIFKPYVDCALPNSEEVCAKHICLPIFAGMTDVQAYRVVDALTDGFA